MSKTIAAIICVFTLLASSTTTFADNDKWMDQVRALAGKGAVLVANMDGQSLFSYHADQAFTPASTLKILIAAAVLDYLGPNYRFITEFRLSPNQDLYVIGRGDPWLVSEELAFITQHLKALGLGRVNNIIVDNLFFTPGLILDGTEKSIYPHDAYNGALCVNFNTVSIEVRPDGSMLSGEPQTPLTDLARGLAKKNHAHGKLRFSLSDDPKTGLLYAGELFKSFLQVSGVEVRGQVKPANPEPMEAPLFYRHQSRKDLRWVVEQFLRYSSNFMTNQVFLTMGAERFGSPADAEKARQVIKDYLTKYQIPLFHVEEGSGLSRKTKITATQLSYILRQFKDYRWLLTARDRAYVKTGTLSDVKALAGYLESPLGEPLTFVIILNGSEVKFDTRDRILQLLEENLSPNIKNNSSRL
ncbi:MAG: D-alanyl-D-alanine carboxypeptidase [Deltaproteobacteria bacterium]|nr:D-alanyl-D-alanine carboxypeptidase [Deltaproteobacteria bacterium]